MKPRVFLAHSKKNLEFIIKIANDLRYARIEPWYDDWEIPSGASLRTAIFEDGISSCDLFFAYITPESIKSYWVTKELDGAFVREVEQQGGFMSLFVDSEETREKLPVDLRSLKIPVFNEKEYSRPLSQLASQAWEAHLRKRLEQQYQESQLQILTVEKRCAELELQLEHLRGQSDVNKDIIFRELRENTFNVGNGNLTLEEILIELADLLLEGDNVIGAAWQLERPNQEKEPIRKVDRGELYHKVIAPLSFMNIVDFEIFRDKSGIRRHYIRLSKFGREIVFMLRNLTAE